MEQKNMDNVEVSDSDPIGLTDLQIYGINGSVVRLLSKVRKYTILTQIQMELVNKSHQIQPIMREIYQFDEIKMVMEIREEFDMFHVYTTDKCVCRNVDVIRDKFDNAISFVTTNMGGLKGGIMDKEYSEILDTFADMLQQIATTISQKSIFDEQFKIS